MGKVATTVEEQIALLESRGMVFDCDIEKVKEILLDIGYYRLGFIGILLKLMINIILPQELDFQML